MSVLSGKKIMLGITGSIAAYKAAFLVRLLIKEGAEVQVLMTPAATRFISALTLSTLSKRPVYAQVSSEEGWNNHVELGLWADAYVIAPATANTLAQMANGLCDTMITAVYLSARCPVLFAPAMDLDMWHHPATRANIRHLESFGNFLIPVGHGELASGLVGEGRMAEPEDIVEVLSDRLGADRPLAGGRVLITAGPTYEPIDPVRFIGNRSSGKMGLELAREAADRGAEVDLILGPTSLDIDHPAVRVHRVKTAREMLDKAREYFPDTRMAILAAAVADYRPEEAHEQKIKSTPDPLTLNLVKNPDIAATLGERKKEGQYLIGFALETEQGLKHARRKLEKKNLDLIVLNTLEDEGAGFEHDTNKVTLVFGDGQTRAFPLKSKREVARDIFDAALSLSEFQKEI